MAHIPIRSDRVNKGAVNLGQGNKTRGRGQRRQNAGAIRRHRFGRVAAAGTAIQRFIDALGDAAAAGEEGVSDSCEAFARDRLDH